MTSVASGGAAARIAARTLFKVLRAGSGTPARYSSTVCGAVLPLAAEPRLRELAFFIRVISTRYYHARCGVTFAGTLPKASLLGACPGRSRRVGVLVLSSARPIRHFGE